MSLPFILKSIESSALLSKAPAASGGIITTYGGFRVHTFLTSGTFVVNTPLINICILLVGGGGGGGDRDTSAGTFFIGAGGGGGGVVQDLSNFSKSAGNYPIIVGAGGNKAVWRDYLNGPTRATNGEESSGLGRSALGGGGGAGGANQYTPLPPAWAGQNGGSGGGGAISTNGNIISPGSGTSGQGYAGSNITSTSFRTSGGGGGGAGQAGNGEQGGNGATSSLQTGSTQYYGGGGGGTHITWEWYAIPSFGGTGGGGNSIPSQPNGVGGLGGGGAGGETGSSLVPGNGGSGIVVIRYTWPQP